MAEIPYFFETPIPKYFRETGWFKNPNTILFVTWAFSKCSTKTHTVVHDKKEITLAPYEFITGRGKSSADCLLSEDAFKHQLNALLKAGLLKKSANSTPNRFTCYIWVTERFSTNNTQLNAQLSANSTPTERPQSRIKKDISNDISKEEALRAAHPASPIRTKDSLSFNFEKFEFEGIAEKDIASWKIMYPHIELHVETLKAAQWLRNNPSKSNKKQWRKYLTGWFERANTSKENKKAYRNASGSSSQDRSTRDINGNPVPNAYEGKF